MMLLQILAPFENMTPLNEENILKALTILWQGLLAIFVTIAIIIAAVALIRFCILRAERRIAKRSEQKDEETDESASR